MKHQIVKIKSESDLSWDPLGGLTPRLGNTDLGYTRVELIKCGANTDKDFPGMD